MSIMVDNRNTGNCELSTLTPQIKVAGHNTDGHRWGEKQATEARDAIFVHFALVGLVVKSFLAAEFDEPRHEQGREHETHPESE